MEAAFGGTTDHQRKQMKIGTYNVMSARGNRLNMAVRELHRMHIHLAVLTEAKLTVAPYTRSAFGYQITATMAASPHQGGIALAWKENDSWHLESPLPHGPNVMSAVMVSGRTKTLIVGVYIPPTSDAEVTTQKVTEACARYPQLPRIILGDLNSDLSVGPSSEFDTAVASAVAEWGVQDTSTYFQPR